MYQETLYPKTKQVLAKIKSIPTQFNFYLAGGTGLALQLGHRKSIDLDFFSSTYPKRDLLVAELKTLNPKVIQEAPGTLDVSIEDVIVTFLEYKYPLLKSLEKYDGVSIASIEDIACMKLSAVSSRGSKKDFIDLYTILQSFELNTLLELFDKKFAGVNYQKAHLLKSLIHFEGADLDPNPDMLTGFSWAEVKKTIEEKVKLYLVGVK